MFFYFTFLNIYYWEKTEVLKTCWKSKFLGKKIRRNSLALKSKKVQDIVTATGLEPTTTLFINEHSTSLAKASDFTPASSKEFLDIQATIECGFTLKCVCDMIKTYSQVQDIFRKTFILGLLSSVVFRLQNCISDFFKLFYYEIKGFYQSSLGNETDYRDIMNVFPNILAKNLNLKKVRHSFVDERTLIKTTLASSRHWKTLAYIFLLAKEKIWKCIFNTNSELLQNRTEKQIMPFNTTVNWLFNDIWLYLVISCFDWKIRIFQQTALRGLLYP